MPTRAASIVRSIAFYAAFYGGSVAFVLVAGVAMFLSARLLQRIVDAWSAWHRGCARLLLGIRVDAEPFIPRAGVLYAIRHESFFEAIDLPMRFPRPVVFAKQELMRIPIWGAAALRYGLIAVDREAGAQGLRHMLAEARRLGEQGRPLVIFPEGTRVPHGTVAPLQAGFAGLYKLLGLPVVPIAVDSGPLYHRRWKRTGTIRYRVGEAIPPGLPRAEVEARVLAAINALNTVPERPR